MGLLELILIGTAVFVFVALLILLVPDLMGALVAVVVAVAVGLFIAWLVDVIGLIDVLYRHYVFTGLVAAVVALLVTWFIGAQYAGWPILVRRGLSGAMAAAILGIAIFL